ncbi:MAG TPA: penicillin-insensitive murein endopeptidase [Rhodospirillales bacterium]|nr:penicillin-insensitive murein endopeptidase [Rhodospirillales bacterium]
MSVTGGNRMAAAVVALSLAAMTATATAGEPDFGDAIVASSPPARVIGEHARGCLGGGEALPLDGDGWQVMRPSRNRFWGHPELIAFVSAFAAQVRAEGWTGLLIGDLAQPRGGPMSSGHRSHQTGLDVDIWFLEAPPLPMAQREQISAVSMVAEGGDDLSAAWTDGHARLLYTAALYPQVDRIFVNPAIKRALCRSIDGDREWLRKLRPWWGHDAHFHVGLHCPAGDADCRERTPPVPAGDGCDASLDWWFSAEAREELRKGSGAPRPRPTIDDLPAACRIVLSGD